MEMGNSQKWKLNVQQTESTLTRKCNSIVKRRRGSLKNSLQILLTPGVHSILLSVGWI